MNKNDHYRQLVMTQQDLKQPYTRQDWQTWLGVIFGSQAQIEAQAENVEIDSENIISAQRFATIKLTDGNNLTVLDIEMRACVQIARNPAGLRELVLKFIDHARYHGILAFYHCREGACPVSTYRLSFISSEPMIDVDGNFSVQSIAPKRYTYVLGENQKTKTPADRLKIIAEKRGRATLEDIKNAFSVETLTKDFYKELSNWYFWALQHVTFPDDVEKQKLLNIENDVERKLTELRNATSVIRLITRLMFVWFLKQKNLIADELFEPQELDNMLNYSDQTGSTYYKAILQNLFFATLNTEMGEKRTFFNRQWGIRTFYRYERFFKNKERFLALTKDTPFLNGGLFENLDKNVGKEDEARIDCFSNRTDNEHLLKVPDFLFFSEEKTIDLNKIYDTKGKINKVRGLIDTLKSYHFTIEENTSTDIEVALDPELLGKVFENLLASYNPETQTTARKQTGSFYTPREIVDYMVEESLKAYLCSNGIPTVEVENLFNSINDIPLCNNDIPVVVTHTAKLIELINNIKVLDPACGSGAFPMGVLQKMVQILQKLDPQNKLWKQRQLAIAEKIEDIEARKAAITNIEEAFEENELDYGRKLFLIENSIFGIDIQPIAVQISKLRFFISLICEQKPNPNKPNMGIRPLPNLETKFVAANTLIGLDKQAILFRTPEIIKKENERNDVLHKHFSARTPKAKGNCRTQDEQLRREITNLSYAEDTARTLAHWDQYNQSEFSPFFDMKWMFGVEDGFDVVIGNPPYGATIDKYDKEYFKKNYESTKTIKNVQKGSLDTFTLFIEKGHQLCKSFGNLHYIVPISITSNDSMTGVHRLLENSCSIIKISSYAVRPKPVFENAVVNTSILFFQKDGKQNEKIFTTKMYRKNKNFNLQYLVNNLQFIDVRDVKLIGRYPKISFEIEKTILKKIFAQEKSIGDLVKKNGKPVFYRTTGGRYYKIITSYSTGSTKEKPIFFDENIASSVGALLSSNLFFWFYQIFSNNLDLKTYEIESFGFPNLTDENIRDLEQIYSDYLSDIEENANKRLTTEKSSYNVSSFKEYKIGKSKHLIDHIDDLICPLYGLTREETAFIKNYEIEFRLSKEKIERVEK